MKSHFEGKKSMDYDLSLSIRTLAKSIADFIPQTEKVEQACSGETKKKITAIKEHLVKDTKIMEDMLKQEEKYDNENDSNDSNEIDEKHMLKQAEKYDNNDSNKIAKIKKLQETVDRIKDDYEYALKTIARLEREIFKLDEKIESHELRITTLQEEVQATRTELSEMKDTLSTGQIAFAFEQDLALYVYPNGKKFGSYKIFTKMKEWLKDKEKTPQGKEANEKWKALQEKVSWSAVHEEVLKKLRDSRIGLAHPSLDLETAKSQIPDNLFTAEEKKCIDDMIDIIKEVNDRM